MKKLIVSIAAVFTFAMASTAAEISNYFPGEIKMVAKLDLEKLRANKLFNMAKEKNADKMNLFKDKFLSESGISVDDIRKVWVAAVEERRGIIVFEGKFDQAAISQAVAKKPEFKAVEKNGCLIALMCPDKRDKSRENLAAMLDENTIVAGIPDLTEKFIESYANGTASFDSNAVKMFSEPKVFKAVLLSVPEGINQKRPMMAGVQGGSFEMDLTDHALFNLQVDTGSQEQAEAIRQIAEGMIKIQKMAKPSDENGAMMKNDFLNNLTIECSGNSIIAQSAINGGTLENAIEMGQQGMGKQ